MIIDPTTRQKRYFTLAQTAANQSSFRATISNKSFAIGCVIVNGNYVVANGFNKNKSHPIQHQNNIKSLHYDAPFANLHAEIDALIRSRYHDLTNCEIYVFRQNANGNLANCRPCPACMNAIKNSGIRHVYYTNDNGFNYERI